MNRHELVDAIGMDAALKLTRAVGGNRVFVSAPAADNPLTKILEPAMYKKLHAAYGQESIDIPSHGAVMAMVRIDMAKALLRSGMSVRQIAKRTKVSRRQVARLKESMNQPMAEAKP